MGILCTLLSLYVFAVFGRVILSWFPIDSGSPLAGVFSFLYTVTEPVLGPARRAIPPIGGFDLSPIIVLFGVQIVRQVIGC